MTIFFLVASCIFALPHLFGKSVFAVASESMEPVYPTGSLIFTDSVRPETVRAGDCITYTYGNNTVTHRVMEVDREKRYFITKGDANSFEDAPVSFDRLVGKASSACVPGLGYFVIWLKGSEGIQDKTD